MKELKGGGCETAGPRTKGKHQSKMGTFFTQTSRTNTHLDGTTVTTRWLEGDPFLAKMGLGGKNGGPWRERENVPGGLLGFHQRRKKQPESIEGTGGTRKE